MNIKNKISKIGRFLNSKPFLTVLFHTLGWVIFILMPYLLYDLPYEHFEVMFRLIDVSLAIAIFYLNMFIFVPKLLLSKKITGFLATVFVGMILAFFIGRQTDEFIPYKKQTVVVYHNFNGNQITQKFQMHPNPTQRMFNKFYERNRPKMMMFSAFLVFALSTSVSLATNFYKGEKNKKEAEKEKLMSELSFLKSQVNPHFLFNVLNNIYSLSIRKSDNLPPIILKLSEMMRYMLYESEGTTVRLEDEVKYMENYIALQKLRMYDDVDIQYKVEGLISDKRIAPMLLIPFIENAFKHGIQQSGRSFIHVLIEVKGQGLYFKSENPYIESKAKDKTSGIGIQNVKRRLELLYPKSHTLSINKDEGNYIVELELRLNNDELHNS